MSGTEKLSPTQEIFVIAAMLKSGIDRDVAEAVVAHAQTGLEKQPMESRNVSVVQRMGVVEAGSTVIGLKVDRIG